MEESTPKESKVVQRKMTPELKMALARYMPISTNPVDRYTPEEMKENLPSEKWPVIHIRKPGSLDLVQSMERTAADAAKAKAMANAQGTTEASTNAISAGTFSPEAMANLGREALKTWRERVIKFENLKAHDGTELAFEAKDGCITDTCLNQVPWQLLLDVHFRYDSLFGLTELEKEGLGSQPASV